MTDQERAFAYIRVSGKAQEVGDGFVRQAAAINQYAKAHNTVIVETYRDTVTGTTDLRAGWTKMIGTCMATGVTTIMIEKLERLARDVMVQEHIIRDTQARKIKLISAGEPDLCENDPYRKLIRVIMGAIAQYDREMLTAKMWAARLRKKQAGGKAEGRWAYGANPMKYPGEGIHLEFMRNRRIQGATLKQVADELNVRNVPTRVPGGRWHGKTVAKILAREKDQ